MRPGKYSWLRKNPLVLFIKQIYQFLKSLIQPNKKLSRPNRQYQIPLVEQPTFSDELDNHPAERSGFLTEIPAIQDVEVEQDEPNDFMTIGELMGEVNWHNYQSISEPKIRPKVQARKNISAQIGRVNLDIRNKDELITVGEMFKKVKWRVPTAIIQEQFLNTSKISPPHDVSRN
jgi:hypothetical protein